MHDQDPGRPPLDDLDEPEADRPEPTGEVAVDEVVDAVASLEERPLEEHAAVFEQAHVALRRTLDATS